MNNIKNIKFLNNKFIVETKNSSVNFNCINEQDKYIIDISALDIINATKTAIFCSTFCFIKNFKQTLCWVVKDEETKRAISILRLKNVEQMVKIAKEEKVALVS